MIFDNLTLTGIIVTLPYLFLLLTHRQKKTTTGRDARPVNEGIVAGYQRELRCS